MPFILSDIDAMPKIGNVMHNRISAALRNSVPKAFIDPYLIKAQAHITMIKGFCNKVNIIFQQSEFMHHEEHI